ncbi:MAG: T9SS type A sorting domain-containing protein [Flavobacterium sp.]|nr:T9SS type A sorting domain-containing protein [Flavobacterium sp.]
MIVFVKHSLSLYKINLKIIIMKKITLFLMMLVGCMGYSQTFPLDFSDPLDLMTGYDGCSASIVTDAGGPVLQVIGSGQLYDTAQLLLTQNLDLSNNSNNSITFRVKPTTGSGNGSHLLKFENGVGGAAQTELAFTTTGTAWQNITLDFGTGLGNYSKVVLFTDFNNGLSGTYLFDDFAGGTNVAPPPAAVPPSIAAPTPPARATADVVSIYSDAYSNIAFNNFDAGWCGAATTPVLIAGNNTLRKNPGVACQGIDFAGNRQNLSAFTHIHFDFYTNDTDLVGDVFNVKLVDFAGGSSEASALEVNINGGTTPQLVANQWVSVDVPITALGGVVAGSLNRGNVAQIGITTANLTNVWYDNIYLHKNTVLGVSNFVDVAFKMYPNPAASELIIESKNPMTSYAVINMLGQEVGSKITANAVEIIEISHLQPGMYFLKVAIDGNFSTQRFIKK